MEELEANLCKPTKVMLSKCKGCGKGAVKKIVRILRCERCMRVEYCNAECQKNIGKSTRCHVKETDRYRQE